MIFTPQIYKIFDKPQQPFIDIKEINSALKCSPTHNQVEEVIKKSLSLQRVSIQECATLLNAPKEIHPQIMAAAKELKAKIYGNRIVLFAPLYVGNLCSNSCDYCSFAATNSLVTRKTLNSQEIQSEVKSLTAEGHKRLILVYGEHPKYSANFIANSVKEVYKNKNIRRVNINAAPLGVEGFKVVKEAGIGTYQIFQESYNPAIYTQHHLAGKKADYNWRLTSLDRAIQAGIDDVGLGVLFGLNPDWKQEVLALIRHTNHLEACFGVGPHTLSFPRITPAKGATNELFPLSDDNFLFLIAVLRLAVPYTGLILTARENAEFRAKAIEFGITQIDGGTKLEVGGYNQESDKGGAQFSLNDNRSLKEIINELVDNNHIPSFCTACYRKGRTGEHFMSFSTSGHIKEFCAPNAILTFAEYLEECGSQELKLKGYEMIEREFKEIKNIEEVRRRVERIKSGESDLYF